MGYLACRTPVPERHRDEIYALAPDDAGVYATIDRMRHGANGAQYHTPTIVLARSIIIPFARRREAAQVDAIYRWLRSRYVFVRDPVGPERVEHPEDMIQEIRYTGVAAGDCDCLSTLVATLGMCVGFPARFVTVGLGRPGGRLPFEHVWCELLEEDAQCWTAIDLAAPREFAGFLPAPGAGRYKFHYV